jgi:acyl-CoA synthetase (NDP forming)
LLPPRAGRRALATAKPIVMLKVETGEVAALVAQAHTGALVSDGRVSGAVCLDLGVVRVGTLKQMLQTADMLGHAGRIG